MRGQEWGKILGLINLTSSVHCQVKAFFRPERGEREREGGDRKEWQC
jgi:hypothetical protein